jgi:hypothetical protein
MSPSPADSSPETKKRQPKLAFPICVVTPPGQRAKWAEIPVEFVALAQRRVDADLG